MATNPESVQNNLANTYAKLGRLDEALSMSRDVYSGRLKLLGEEHPQTLLAANNLADILLALKRFEEAKALLRKMVPVAQRVRGDSNEDTLRMRWIYAAALFYDPGAMLDDVREAVTTLDDKAPIARRVLGGAHPITAGIERDLRNARAALRARETPSPGSS